MTKPVKRSIKPQKKSKISKVKTDIVTIHPISLKELNKGHPWVTSDEFSLKFPHQNSFLKVEFRDEYIVLINDPNHKTIKARLWDRIDKHESFNFDLNRRVYDAISKRQTINLEQRNNFYLIFGEADFIPGLFVQYLNGHILIQSHLQFWNHYKTRLINSLEKNLSQIFKERQVVNFYWQNKYGNFTNIKSIKRRTIKPFWISEYGVQYKIDFNLGDEFGFFTDMSSIRLKILPYLKQNILNLYSYTGAFSLYSLNSSKDSCIKSVTSVDSSQVYLNILEENLKKNSILQQKIDKSEIKHSIIKSDVLKACKKLNTNKQKFDSIICDPPSFSHSRGSFQQAFKQYKILIPLFCNILNKDGYIICFLNTHKITWKKFNAQIQSISKENKLIIEQTFRLQEDCPRLKNFNEGDYLKCFILKKA